MRSRSPNYHMTRLSLVTTQQRVILPSKNYSTHADGVASPTTLYLCLEHNESNTSFIFSQLSANQFRRTKTTRQFLHMEGGIFLPILEEEAKMRMVRGR